MALVHLVCAALLMAAAQVGQACYQECSAIFNQKIQQLVGLRDTSTLTQRSCLAMSEQITCLEGKKSVCDATSLQYVNSILNFIRPDYDRTCSKTAGSNTTAAQTSAQQLLAQCSHKGNQCYVSFNSTYAPALLQQVKNMTVICKSLDDYVACLEQLVPECGQYLGRAISSIRFMQQQYSYVCASGTNAEAATECIKETMDCYEGFNTTFVPALSRYSMAEMCSAMDNYTSCLNTIHERQECQRYTQQALAGILTLKRRYSMYCGSDGGQQAQKCVMEFQKCYDRFNSTYFPAMHRGNMDGICSSVTQYWDCSQPLYTDCGQQLAQALSSVRILREQMAVQCDPEFRKLTSCAPLMACLRNFATGYSAVGAASSSSSLCTNLSSYFPCVEDSLAQCNISADSTTVDFSHLGSLTGAYCRNLLGNRVLNTCPEFARCTAGIVLVSTPDPSAMFDASTWCTYMDMSLSCVERAINTPQCGLTNDDTIRGHLTQQRDLKRDICKLASVPPLSTPSPNAIPSDDTTAKSDKPHEKAKTGGQEGSDAVTIAPAVASLVLTVVLSLAARRQ